MALSTMKHKAQDYFYDNEAFLKLSDRQIQAKAKNIPFDNISIVGSVVSSASR